MGTQKYGDTLPDQIERISALYDAHLGLVNDIRDLYRDRAALEREYAGKLQVLSRKALEKKTRSAGTYVVGDEPTKAWDERTLKQSTLDRAYSELIDSMTNAAQDHVNLADAMTTQVVEPLKIIEKKNDDTKKKEMAFFDKLLSDRDRIYSDRTKSKQKYDEECVEVESYRQKQGRASDDKHADRAAKQYEQQRIDMLNSKNVYVISTAIANRAKTKFYSEDLPTLENQFQDLQTRLIGRCMKILAHAQALQSRHQDSLKGRWSTAENAVNAIQPAKDQELFIDHNIRPFTAPADWTFEPCPSHYDTAEMSVEQAPKVFLQNKLNRCQMKLQELAPLLKAKEREVEQCAKLIEAYANNNSLGDAEEVMDNYLEAKQQLTFFSSSQAILTTEIDAILEALGDDVGENRPHDFKSSSFSIPTPCGFCKSSIWGLSKQGKTCKLCGLCVHGKCELKVPADCSASHGGLSIPRTSSTMSRQTSRVSSATPKAAPSASSFVKADAPDAAHEAMTGKVMFDFMATSPFELSISEGTPVTVLEEDDGSGWVKVASAQGKGLVPASYVELANGDESEDKVPSRGAHQSKQGSGQYVRAVYAYEAQGSDELPLHEKEVVELSAGSTGGQNYADGWWEGINSEGRKGIFPSNYVEMA